MRVVETFDQKLWQAGQVVVLFAGLAHREDKCDRLGEEPTRDEGEHLRRSAIEPLGVVDDAYHRPIRRGL